MLRAAGPWLRWARCAGVMCGSQAHKRPRAPGIPQNRYLLQSAGRKGRVFTRWRLINSHGIPIEFKFEQPVAVAAYYFAFSHFVQSGSHGASGQSGHVGALVSVIDMVEIQNPGIGNSASKTAGLGFEHRQGGFIAQAAPCTLAGKSRIYRGRRDAQAMAVHTENPGRGFSKDNRVEFSAVTASDTCAARAGFGDLSSLISMNILKASLAVSGVVGIHIKSIPWGIPFSSGVPRRRA